MCDLSPLTRGTRCWDNAASRQSRFIPAAAGNTQLFRVRSSARAVYPRCRGEHSRLCASSVISVGLSPQPRGTRSTDKTPGGVIRFIPAGAGNTIFCMTARFQDPVYPRWRGEHILLSATIFPPFGLSPLARGTRECVTRNKPTHRFIPAGAGNTH